MWKYTRNVLIYNSLYIISICRALGVNVDIAIKTLQNTQSVKERVENVSVPCDYTVIIDYAHSEDGIINVLDTIKGFAKGRIISVVGCGGDRDKSKRPLMGKASCERADFSIITSDNPRTEDPYKFIKNILKGIKEYKGKYKVITVRRKAIHYALKIGQKDDVIVFFGKGHETYQDINGIKHHFDEREVISDYFEKKIKTLEG